MNQNPVLRILSYTKKDVIHRQHPVLVHEISGIDPEQEWKIEPDTKGFKEYVISLQKILNTLLE